MINEQGIYGVVDGPIGPLKDGAAYRVIHLTSADVILLGLSSEAPGQKKVSRKKFEKSLDRGKIEAI